MKKNQNISEAELEVMQVLWESDQPLKVQDICDRLVNSTWNYKTVATLLLRMEGKGAVVSEKSGRVNYYKPVMNKEKYVRDQTRSIIAKLYHGSAKELAVSLFQSGEMTKEEIEEIRKLFHL